jgi:prepilin-type N-terminal cleavage/methylation domain-containing protein
MNCFTPPPSRCIPRPRHHRGVTLVELLVGLVIGLIISSAAVSLFTFTRATTRATQSVQDVNEIGRAALDFIAREIEQAGSFPNYAHLKPIGNASDLVPGQFDTAQLQYNTVGTTNGSLVHRAMPSGLFGCTQQLYSQATGTCVGSSPYDRLVVQRFEVANSATRPQDCNSNDVTGDPVNQVLFNAAPTTVDTPVLVSNIFTITQPETYRNVDNVENSLPALGCRGLRDGALISVLEGVVDLVLRYQTFTDPNTRQGSSMLSANQVSNWNLVSAVHICIVVRSMTGARTTNNQSIANVDVDSANSRSCPGSSASTNFNAIVNNNFLYRKFERTVALRSSVLLR